MPLNLSAWRTRGGALLAVSLALLAACGKPPPPPEPVRAVKLITVGEDRYESGHEYAAEVRARVESRLGFRVAGKIVRRAVEPGQRVQAGQLLAQLDARDYQLAADAARAQVAAASTQRDLAAADLKRFESLRAQGFISGAEIERRSAQLKAAQATLEQARAQLASQGNQAGYTQLLADAAGVVTGVDAEVGQVVAAGTRNQAVSTAGLKPGMKVVASGVHVLAPGQQVTVYQPRTAPAASAPAAVDDAAAGAAPAAAAASR